MQYIQNVIDVISGICMTRAMDRIKSTKVGTGSHTLDKKGYCNSVIVS